MIWAVNAERLTWRLEQKAFVNSDIGYLSLDLSECSVAYNFRLILTLSNLRLGPRLARDRPTEHGLMTGMKSRNTGKPGMVSKYPGILKFRLREN